jgi:hypothetical protein
MGPGKKSRAFTVCTNQPDGEYDYRIQPPADDPPPGEPKVEVDP